MDLGVPEYLYLEVLGGLELPDYRRALPEFPAHPMGLEHLGDPENLVLPGNYRVVLEVLEGPEYLHPEDLEGLALPGLLQPRPAVR